MGFATPPAPPVGPPGQVCVQPPSAVRMIPQPHRERGDKRSLKEAESVLLPLSRSTGDPQPFDTAKIKLKTEEQSRNLTLLFTPGPV